MFRINKNLKLFKLITFDVTDTLLGFRHPAAIEYVNAAKQFGHNDIVADQVTQLFSKNFKHMARTYPNFGRVHEMAWEDWWRKLIANILLSTKPTISPSDTIRIADALIEKYKTAECWTKFPQANELIEAVRKTQNDSGTIDNKCIGIISNFDPRLRCIVQDIRLPNFDFILTSYEAGTAKPSPEIFGMALKMGCDCTGDIRADQALHIGNTATLDYLGAKAAGWHSILITDTHVDDLRQKHGSMINEQHVFKSIAHLLHALNHSNIEW